MVGIGVLMMLIGAVEPVAALRAGISTGSALLLRLAVLMGPSGFVAVLAGWITTEVGRQPYTVYGLLRTAQSVSPIDCAGGRRLAAGLHRRLLRRVRRRHLLHPAPDGAHAAARRAGHRDRRCPCAPPASRRRRRCRRLPTRRERDAHVRPRLHLGRADRLRRAGLRAVRRLRPRHRHPVPVRWLRERPRPGHELGGPGLGRQRDLAGARRRRADGGLPARLRRRAAGALRADHAMLLGLVFRGVAFEFRWRATRQAPVGLGLRRRLDAGRLRAGHRARRAGAGHPGLRPRLCRRLVGLADAVQPAHRRRPGASATRCSAPPG